MTVKEAIEKGKELITAWQMAYFAQDLNLMEIIRRKRAAFEVSLMRDYGNDFMDEYYKEIDTLDEFNFKYLKNK